MYTVFQNMGPKGPEILAGESGDLEDGVTQQGPGTEPQSGV